MKKYFRTIAWFSLIALFIPMTGMAQQVTISGQTCVTGAVSYLYSFSGKYDTSTTVKICITGGNIEGIASNCIEGKWQSFVKVSWNDNNANGSITINTPNGNTTFNVNVTAALNPGKIESADLDQVIADSIHKPATIHCSVAQGGNCSPGFQYQWQQSNDKMGWTDINGATGQQLSFTIPVKQMWYYRRRVKETRSGTIGYSDIASVVVVVPQMAANYQIKNDFTGSITDNVQQDNKSYTGK